MTQQLVQGPLVRHPEVRQHMVIDRYTTAQPAVGIVLLAQLGHPPGTAHPLHSRQQPQGQQHLRVRGGPTGMVHHRLNGAIEGRQVQLLQQPPDSTGRVVLGHCRLQIHSHPLNLLPYRPQDTRLIGPGRCSRPSLLGFGQFKQRRLRHGSLQTPVSTIVPQYLFSSLEGLLPFIHKL